MNLKSLKSNKIGNDIVFLESVDSTNTYLKTYITNNPPKHGFVVLAQNQTNGKGQNGSSWLVEPNTNVTMSLCIVPKERKVLDAFYVNKTIAIAIARTVGKYCREVSIKWPNDIYVSDKKISGVLIENSLNISGDIKYMIIGIGVNVLQQNFDPNLPNPTSIVNEGINIELFDFVEGLLDNINKSYTLFEESEYDQITNIYNDLLYRKELKSRFVNLSNNQPFEGEILNVDKYGVLNVKVEGELLQFAQKEIKYVI